MNEKFLSTFEMSNCTEVTHAIEFGGRTFKPDRAKAMFEAIMCHTLPKGNLNDRGFTAATMANSYKSAELQLVDFDHRLKFYGTDEDGEDRVCGTIAAIDFPDRDQAIAMEKKGTPVPLRALLVAFRKAKGVESMLQEISDKKSKSKWRTSVEVEYPIATAALYDTVDEKFYAWSECTDEMKALVKPGSVGKFNGHKMLFIPGGEDGKLIVTGCAFTRWPADTDATLEQMAASKKIIVINAGWRCPNDYQQAIASVMAAEMRAAEIPVSKEAPPIVNRPKPKPLGEFLQLVASLPTLQKAKEYCKAVMEIQRWNTENPDEVMNIQEIFKANNPIVGHTDAADGHKHAITKNMQVLPANGHQHYVNMMSMENCSDGLHACGVTSSRGSHVTGSDGTSSYVEHCHTFDLGGMGSSEMSGVGTKEVESMDTKERIKSLRVTAQAIATSNPAESKLLTELANAIEKEVANEGVEEVIAARIKAGDLIPKATHEAAVATASTTGETKVRNEIAEQAKKEQEKATTIAARMEQVSKAKIDTKFTLGKDRTVASEVASIPVGPEGDKEFAKRLEEWTTISASTGQMKATEQKDEAGSVRPPLASTNSAATPATKKHGKLGVC